MKVRYKKTGIEDQSSRFNIMALSEVLTSDDSVFVADLDVYIEAIGSWIDMNTAFENGDIITDNYNRFFFEPTNDEDRKRGYTL